MRSGTVSEQNLLYFLKGLCGIIGIDTRITWSSDYTLFEDKNERLLSIIEQSQSEYYLSGPAANTYIDEQLFKDKGVELVWMDYSEYPVYQQQWDRFDHGVSILDLLFNVGPNIQKYLKFFQTEQKGGDCEHAVISSFAVIFRMEMAA